MKGSDKIQLMANGDDQTPMFQIHQDEFDEDMRLEIPESVPLIALKNMVLFPGIIMPINVSREQSLRALQAGQTEGQLIAVTTQVDAEITYPKDEDLYHIGTLAKLLRLINMPDGSTTAILQGQQRIDIEPIHQFEPHMTTRVSHRPMLEIEDEMPLVAISSTIKDKAQRIIELSPQIPDDANVMLRNIKSPHFLIRFIASNLNTEVFIKQQILADDDLMSKATTVLHQLDKEVQLLEIKDQIESKVRNDIEKQQRDYFLNQQLKTIQQELGDSPNEADVQRLTERAEKMNWPAHAKEAFDRSLEKLKRVNPQIAEYSLILTYLEILLDLPWHEIKKTEIDLHKVVKILDQDHFGLTKVKERIIEHLAVLKLKNDMKSPILCLVGPPGVGKTSLGRSIADALGRDYVRMSLGGLHDEAEIRGHRKTYIGAMPGRVIQSIKKAGSSNPVFILDEIDKLGRDFRGDPASALLEVLDPEQNTTFQDNYLELEYDLSQVLFIATANSLNTIPRPLLDRMEIIQVSGYSTEEKLEIAKRHLIPKQRKEHGLKGKNVRINKAALTDLIELYTRESGVRNLDRAIATVMRKVAKQVAMGESFDTNIRPEVIAEMMGPSMSRPDVYDEVITPGVAIGLAWTSVGGDILFIESSLSEGKGKVTLTGNLGDVMKESATTAMSFVRAHSDELGIDPDRFSSTDLHIHVPEGAIPKDGPSAGITMLSTIASAFTGRAVRPYVAMTGEITLRGKVLPVGGIKEKVLAAKRAGVQEVVLCEDNRKHIEDIDQVYLSGLHIHYVTYMEDVLDFVLEGA